MGSVPTGIRHAHCPVLVSARVRRSRGTSRTVLYSPECVEGKFSELPLLRSIESSRRAWSSGIMLICGKGYDPLGFSLEEAARMEEMAWSHKSRT